MSRSIGVLATERVAVGVVEGARLVGALRVFPGEGADGDRLGIFFPLLLVGLVALGIMFLSWRIMPRTISGRVLTRSQAVAIIYGAPLGSVPQVAVGYGMYVGLIASLVLVAFGLTIVIKRASQPYVVSAADDDVE